MAASSTCAEVAMNLAWAFMNGLLWVRGTRHETRYGAQDARRNPFHAPYAGMTRIRFEGTLSPGNGPDPCVEIQYSPARGRMDLTSVGSVPCQPDQRVFERANRFRLVEKLAASAGDARS